MNSLINTLLILLTLSHFLSYTNLYTVAIIIKISILSILGFLSILHIKNYNFSILILILIFILLFLNLFSLTLINSYLYLFLLILYLLVVYLLIHYQINVIKIFWLVSSFLLILSILNTFIDPSSISFRGSNIALQGIFNNNNSLGQLALFNIFSLCLLYYNKQSIKISGILYFVIPVIIGLFSSSRSVLISIGFLIIILFIIKKLKYKPIILIGLAGIVIILIERINTFVFDLMRVETLSLSSLSNDRLNLVKVFSSNLDDIPLYGLGLGNQSMIWDIGDSFSNIPLYLRGLGFHNTFIQIYIELGVIGFISLIILFIFLIYKAARYKMHAVLIVFLGILISSFFESNILYITSPLSILFWYIVIKISVYRRE